MIINKSEATKTDIETLNSLDTVLKKNENSFTNIRVQKPWGSEYLLFENDDVAIWILKINPKEKTSMHCHVDKSTSLISLSGQLRCDTLDNSFELKTLEGIYLGKKVFHQTTNISDEAAIVMEIESPVNKSDLIRKEDNYGRTGQPYEKSNNYIKEDNLTITEIKNKNQRKFNTTNVIIGKVETKREFLNLCKEREGKVIVTLLNRHIWSNEGKKEFEVGQVFVGNEEILEENRINDNFIYMIISKE
ncbi:hypothetical protein ACMC56_15675 [Campylobacterota bacterium DY0563]